ncbi:MAG TPA: carbohydrate kinase family protein [Salinimicrobium sp.]|nr:carbohydrate kinase family protein [Salinimicrobium sp.]
MIADKKLLVVGELNVDLILNNIQGFPKIGSEIVANTMNFTLGSSSAILASNISAMGVKTSFCGMVGDDEFGRFVVQELENKNVDTQFIKKASTAKTGITVVMSYDQDRANVTYCGAMEDLTINEIPWGQIADFNHFHLSNFFLQKGITKDIVAIFRKAKEAGLTTSLDLQWDPDNQWDFDYKACLPFVDIFLPNEAELLALSGKDNLEDAEKELLPHSNIIALKMGEKGAKVLTKNSGFTAEPFHNRTYKDSIGAGDSFNAGFVKKYLDDASLEECLHHANLMGSLNTTKRGGTTAFASPEAIEEQKKKILKKEL